MSAATEITQTGSPSSPTGRRTGERGCLLSLTWFHHKRVSAQRALFFLFISEKVQWKQNFLFQELFLKRLILYQSCGTWYESHHVQFVLLHHHSVPSLPVFLCKCPTRMQKSLLFTQIQLNPKLLSLDVYKSIKVSLLNL